MAVVLEPPAPSAPLIVTCVHGTFVRGQRWPQLEAAIAGATFRYFTWSGWNLLASRARAAARLRRSLEEEVSRHPGAQHLIAAHSHGANIVLHALKDANPSVREAVAGIVFFSPALLTCELVEEPRYIARLQLLGAWFLALVALPFLRPVTFAYGVPMSTALIVTAALAAVGLLWFWPWRVCRRARVLEGRLRLPVLDFPGLIIRAPADEATMALSSSAMFSRIAARARAAILRPQGFSEATARQLREADTVPNAMTALGFAAVVPTIALVCGLTLASALFTHRWLFALALFLILLRLGLDAIVLASPSMYLTLAMTVASFFLLPFGILPTAAAALLTVSVDSAPTPRWQVVELPARSVFRQRGWQHSTPTNPAAIAAVAAYVGSRVRECAGS